MKNEAKLRENIKGKRILYLATKNSDYIRVSQEIDMVKELGKSVDVIVFPDKKYLSRILKVYVKLLITDIKQYDVIFVGFMAQMILPVFMWKLHKKIIITDFFISIYDTLVFDRKKIKESSLPAKICKWIDKLTIKKSTYLISDTKTHGQYFVEELGARTDKIYVCYLKADKKIYYPRILEKPKQYRDQYLVLYFGSILPVQGVDIVMETIKGMENVKDVHFIIIGPIGEKIEKANTDNVTYINWLPQEELAEYIAFSDLCLAGHFSNTVNKAKRTIPGKAYIYQAMEKKMILGDSPANRELFREDKDVLFVSLGCSQELRKRILVEAYRWRCNKNERFNISDYSSI